MQLKYVFLLVAIAVAEKQVKLEDIERDNLLSERHVNVNPDDQTQNLQPSPQSTIQQSAGASYEVRASIEPNCVHPPFSCYISAFQLEFW